MKIRAIRVETSNRFALVKKSGISIQPRLDSNELESHGLTQLPQPVCSCTNSLTLMGNAVFTTKVDPGYDDLPEFRYHFPSTYLNQAKQAVGDWIVYYEPRREGADLSGRAGRQCYFATARVLRIEEDKSKSGHFYAYMTDYLEFSEPVPFKLGETYPEIGLRKDDGSEVDPKNWTTS